MKCLSNIKSYLKKARTPKIKVKTKTKVINTILIFILGIILGSSLVWSSKSYKPNELAIQALNSDKKIEVKNDKFISFTPKDKEVEKGFIFYPGAGVEPEA